MQRMFDIFLSVFAIVLLSPVFLVASAVLKLSGEGEVFFRQVRVGKMGKKFELLKFATMLKNSPNIGTRSVTVQNDPRILPVGRILRKTKINELPQLFNVAMGDMSLIGPRPLTPENFEMYSVVVQSSIKQVRPGLSGIGSIFFRDEEKFLSGNNASTDYYREVLAPYKGELEMWFVSNRGLGLYLRAIIGTMLVVLFPNSGFQHKIFSSVPKPNNELRVLMAFPDERLHNCRTNDNR